MIVGSGLYNRGASGAATLSRADASTRKGEEEAGRSLRRLTGITAASSARGTKRTEKLRVGAPARKDGDRPPVATTTGISEAAASPTLSADSATNHALAITECRRRLVLADRHRFALPGGRVQ